jgi:hypothetical protein
VGGQVLLQRQTSLFGFYARLIGNALQSLVFRPRAGPYISLKISYRRRELGRGSVVVLRQSCFFLTAHDAALLISTRIVVLKRQIMPKD